MQSDTNPGHIIVNWFHQRNKKVSMRISGVDAADNATRLANANDPSKNRTDTLGQTGLLLETPQVADRLYLYIRCNDYVVNTAADGASTAASMDIAYTTTYYANV